MNYRIAGFMNDHSDEIDSGDFFSVYISAYGELSNDDTSELTADLILVFDEDMIFKQREAALRFILLHAAEEMDPATFYTIRSFKKHVIYGNTLGLTDEFLAEYLAQNANEFDMETSYTGGHTLIIRKKE